MKRYWGLFHPQARELIWTLARMEFRLMEQGTPVGFVLAFANNILMLLVFHLLFVSRLVENVPNTWVYLLLGIVQWNLYMNISLAGFACFVYRQKLVMGYTFPRELLILARTAAVYFPYLIELLLILGVARYFGLPIGPRYSLLPGFLVCQFFFCASICSIFAFIGVIHKNIIPFWNLMFRLLSFATPIFYVPFHFKSWWADALYYANPFTLFMMWVRDITYANAAVTTVPPQGMVIGSILFFLASYELFRFMEPKVGDHL